MSDKVCMMKMYETMKGKQLDWGNANQALPVQAKD